MMPASGPYASRPYLSWFDSPYWEYAALRLVALSAPLSDEQKLNVALRDGESVDVEIGDGVTFQVGVIGEDA